MDIDTYNSKIVVLKSMIKSFKEYNDNYKNDTTMGKIINTNSSLITNLENILLEIEDNINGKNNLELELSVEEEDTKEYKKNYSLLNASFWEAREKVSVEKIKYPSSLYEKKVKEYQNQFLIDNYNTSLEEVEYNIDSYKKKYAYRIYMDSVYDRAFYSIKDDNLYTIEEICDDSNGVSLLDKTVYIILTDDLEKINRQLLVSDDIDKSEFSEVSEFKKELNRKNLNDRKKIIEEQMKIIENKAKEFDEEI